MGVSNKIQIKFIFVFKFKYSMNFKTKNLLIFPNSQNNYLSLPKVKKSFKINLHTNKNKILLKFQHLLLNGLTTQMWCTQKSLPSIKIYHNLKKKKIKRFKEEDEHHQKNLLVNQHKNILLDNVKSTCALNYLSNIKMKNKEQKKKQI